MPGVFGCAGLGLSPEQIEQVGQRISAALQQLHPEDHLTIQSHMQVPFLIGSHGVRSTGQRTDFIQSGNVFLALSGKLVVPDLADGSGVLLELFSKQGLHCVEQWRGHFAVAIVDNQQGDIWLFTDHAASRPIYYAFQDGALYFASDCPALAQALPWLGAFNQQAVADMLTFGYLTGVKTPISGINSLPAGSYLHWDVQQRQPKVGQYFTTDNSPLEALPYQTLRDEMERLFVQAVQRALWSTSGLFTLSGGLDSRAITATARRLGVTRPDCLIFGEAESLDVRLAQQVARALDAQAHVIGLDNGDYLIDTFPTAARYNGGMVYYNGSAHLLHALQSIGAQRWDVVHTGMSGDMLMGSFLHAADIAQPLNGGPVSLASRIIADHGETTWIDRFARHPEEMRQTLGESVLFSLEQIKAHETASLAQVLELWNLQNRQQRSMFNGFRQIEHFTEFTSPFFDVDLYHFVLRIPHRYRLGEAIYIDMLSRLLPRDVWSIPWEKTRRPPSRHIWINRLNKSTSMWLGRAVELVFPQTFRRRSMNPFRVWLRDNKSLQRFAVEQLMTWSDLPTFLDRDKVRSFADDIAAGRWGVGSRTTIILFRLLTLSAWPSLYASGQPAHIQDNLLAEHHAEYEE